MLFKMTEPEVKPISPPRSELTLLCRDARGSPLRLGLRDEIWQGHILVTGGTGSGKTTVIRQLLARCRDVYPDASFLVLDVKGDYVPYRRPGDKVFSFYGGEDAFRWNILEEARASPHPEDELDEMVSVLFSSRVNTAGQNRFFVQAASQVFYGYLLVTLRQCRAGRPAPTHAEMAKWLKKCTLEQMQDRLMLEEDELSGIVSLLKGREAASILSEVHLFAHDFFRGAAEGHDSVAEFITHRGRALYLQYDASRAESGKLSCSIILNRAIAQLLSKDWCRRRVFFILDEAATLPADYGLEKLLALGRDRGARVLGVFQNHDQVQAMFAGRPSMESDANNVLSQFSSVMAFHPNSERDVEFARERLGKTDMTTVTFGLSRYEPPHVAAMQDCPVTARQLQSLGVGEAYIRLRDYAPAKVYFEKEQCDGK